MPEIGEYTENTGSYSHIGNMQLTDGETAKLFLVQVSAFYSSSPALYFIEYQHEYFFLPSISIGMGKATDIEKILSLQKWILRADLHLFEESKFLGIFGEDYSVPSTIVFQKNQKTYTLSLIRRMATTFSSENLRKLDDLSVQV